MALAIVKASHVTHTSQTSNPDCCDVKSGFMLKGGLKGGLEGGLKEEPVGCDFDLPDSKP